MSCINPISITTNNKYKQSIQVDCRYCLNCLVKRQSQLIFLAQKEQLYKYRNNQGCSFVTLTYDDNHLPRTEKDGAINGKGFVTLRRSDVQKFIKNMRRQMDYYNVKKDFKLIYCGEYGDGSHSTSKTGVSTCRPHYHIAFLGLSQEEVILYTRKLWKHGLCDVGVLTSGGLRYICKYMSKASPTKAVKQIREAAEVQNPFIYHSVGLGKQWIIDHMQKIVDDEFTFNINGKKYFFPRHVCSFIRNHTGIDYIPYYIKFIKEGEKKISDAKGISYTEYDYEKSYISYKMKVYNCRAKGVPVDDITLNKAYVRPFHKLDRSLISKLVDSAYAG